MSSSPLMDGSFVNTNQILELFNSSTLPEDITSQTQITHLQNNALLELNTHLRNRDFDLFLSYLNKFLAINSDINWNLHNQFHVDSLEFIKIILKNANRDLKQKIKQHFNIKLSDENSKLTDLVLFIDTIDFEDKVDLLDNDKQLLNYYCNLTEEYDHDDEYLKNVYLKKISLLEDYFTSLKTSNKEHLIELIPFIEQEFKEKLTDNDFIGKKCYLCSLSLSVITKEYYEQFDLKLLFTSFNLSELINDYNIIEFNLAIQFYKQFFTTVSKRKSLYKFLKPELSEILSEIVKILTDSKDFSIIESYSKSYIFQILSKISTLDGKLLITLFNENGINLKNDSDYKYMLEFYSFLDPSFIIKFYKQELKKCFSIHNFSINIYNHIPVLRNICSNEELWQFIAEPVLPICKSLPMLEKLVLLEKFTQYEHCLKTLLKQETWLFLPLSIEISDEELILLKENSLNNLLIKNGDFVRETDPVFYKKLKAEVFGNDREAKVSVATMTK